MPIEIKYNQEVQTISIYNPNIDQLTILPVEDLITFLRNSDLLALLENTKKNQKEDDLMSIRVLYNNTHRGARIKAEFNSFYDVYIITDADEEKVAMPSDVAHSVAVAILKSTKNKMFTLVNHRGPETMRMQKVWASKSSAITYMKDNGLRQLGWHIEELEIAE